MSSGEALLEKEEYNLAAQVCDEALEINSDNEKAWLCKARALKSNGLYWEEANDAYEEVIRINKDNADAWYEWAFVLWVLEKEDEAAEAYDEVVRINPQHANAWNAKGKAHAEREEYDEAIKAFDEAIQLDPNNSEYQENRREALANSVKSMT